MAEDKDVVIVGGGLVGPLSAVALASHGISSVVVDTQKISARKSPEFDGRAYALSYSSIEMLKVLGIWDVVSAHAEPILDIKVSDGRPGQGASPFFVHFDHRELEEGPFGHLLEDRFLRRALLDRVAAEPLVDHLGGVSVTGMAPGRIETDARRKADRKIACKVTIGCDGRGSSVATWAGIARTGWTYGQTSLVCAIEHERPHNGVAHQFFTPAGPLAILPMPGHRSAIVWTEEDARAQEINGRDDAGYLDALRPVFGDFLGELSLVGKRFSYPLGLSVAQSLVAERMALAGDAAHGIHPIAGQGFNLGLRDVAALTEVLVTAKRRGEDIGSSDVLKRYARWRSFDISAMVTATDGINRLFSNDNPMLRTVRDLGLGAISRIPALRRGMMREAAGLTGDLPQLLRGQRI